MLFFFFNNCMYFRLCWVFTAVLRFSLAAERKGGRLQSRSVAPSLQGLLWFGSMGSGVRALQ